MIIKRAIAILAVLALSFSISAESISNEYCTFSVPQNMEVQESGLQKDESALYSIVLQQKGLNDYELDAFSDYARITITANEWTGGVGALASEELKEFDSMMEEMIKSLYNIPKWNGIKMVSFKGYTAYVMDYIRSSVTGKGDVHVYSLTFSTESHDWTIVFAAREENLDLWTPSFRSFASSFEAKETENTMSKYLIKDTSRYFYWYRTPSWKTEYVDGIKCNTFEDMVGDFLLAITVLDYSRYVSYKYEKLALLTEAQKQVGLMVLSEVGGMSIKAKENKIDSRKLTYTYRYTYSEYGINVEGIIHYSFSGSKCIAYTSEWREGSKAEYIVEKYLEME